ncbi:hypothetical protein TcasGA2_TC007138 [Tribolium castaneum]|uniref:Uncharacterized protein n=1 Tax=Tribolium castaneum TaxID=7070 RepID=D2A177_TRICA|nr:hypothetical protein TcasGA2_TC007138 [Tribolium castaneum]
MRKQLLHTFKCRYTLGPIIFHAISIRSGGGQPGPVQLRWWRSAGTASAHRYNIDDILKSPQNQRLPLRFNQQEHIYNIVEDFLPTFIGFDYLLIVGDVCDVCRRITINGGEISCQHKITNSVTRLQRVSVSVVHFWLSFAQFNGQSSHVRGPNTDALSAISYMEGRFRELIKPSAHIDLWSKPYGIRRLSENFIILILSGSRSRSGEFAIKNNNTIARSIFWF